MRTRSMPLHQHGRAAVGHAQHASDLDGRADLIEVGQVQFDPVATSQANDEQGHVHCLGRFDRKGRMVAAEE
jgi:hypothetical protein